MAGSDFILMPLLAWDYLLNLWDLEMKLLDMLVSEIPALGGWPEDAHFVIQSSFDGELYFFNAESEMGNEFRGVFTSEIAEDSPEITKEQYLNALAASGTDK